jgi:hypothetical protein
MGSMIRMGIFIVSAEIARGQFARAADAAWLVAAS